MVCRNSDSCRKLFFNLEILPLPSQCIFSVLLFMIRNGNQFLANSEICHIDTRQHANFRQPSVNLTEYKQGEYYLGVKVFNPLNAELNPICHLLILLGDLTFMGTCIVSIFQYISNKMQCYTVYLYRETALHASGGTSTHHQERVQLYLQHLVFVTPLLLSAAIVEELEPV